MEETFFYRVWIYFFYFFILSPPPLFIYLFICIWRSQFKEHFLNIYCIKKYTNILIEVGALLLHHRWSNHLLPHHLHTHFLSNPGKLYWLQWQKVVKVYTELEAEKSSRFISFVSDRLVRWRWFKIFFWILGKYYHKKLYIFLY